MIEAFKLLGRIVLEGGETVTRQLTSMGGQAESAGRNMQSMGNQASQAGNQASKSINEAGQAARTTSGAMSQAGNAAQTMGNTMNRAGEAAYSSYRRLPPELRSLSRHLGEMDQATRDMFNQLSQAYKGQEQSMRGLDQQTVRNRLNWLQLNQAAKDFTGTNQEFMEQVRRLGAEEKKVNDARLKANELGRMAILQQVGAMTNLSSQASKISSVYEDMANPLYSVNQAGLAVADSLNRMANAATPAALALRQLGPNASMKDLRDRIGLITQGIMRMQAVALATGTVLAGFTVVMAKAAMGPDVSKTRQAMAEIKAEYQKALADRKQELYTWAGLFENVEIKVPSASKLLSALGEQVNVFKKWTQNLKTLTQRGVDQGFIAELQKMGPKSAGEVQALVNMTGPQLDKYVSLWREKHKLAADQATSELARLKQETDRKVQELANSLTPLGLSVERFKGVWAQALGPFVEIWGKIAAKVVDAGTKIGEFVQKMNQVSPLITQVAGMFAYLVSVLGLLLTPLAAGIGLFGGLAAAWGALAPLVMPLVTGLAAMSGTVLLVAAGITALVAVIALIVKAFNDWNAKTGEATRIFNQSVAAIKANADRFIQPLANLFNQVMTKIKSVVQSMLGEATQFWQQHGTQVMQAVQNFSTMMLAVWNVLMPAIKFIVQGVVGAIVTIFKGLFDAVMGLVKVFTGVFTGDWKLVWEGVKQILQGAIEIIWGWINLTFFGRILKGAGAFFGSLKGAFTSGWNAIKTGVTGFITSVKTYFTNMKNDFMSIFTAMREGGLSIWQSLKSAITFVVDGLKTTITTWATAVWNAIKTAFTNTQTSTTTIWNAIKNFFTTTFTALKTAFTTSFNFLKTTVTNVFNACKTVIQTVWNFIKTYFTTSFTAWKTLFTNTFNFLKTTVTNAFNATKTTATTVWNAIKSALSTIFTALRNAGTNAFNGLKNSVSKIINSLKSSLSNSWNTIKNFATNSWKTTSSNVQNSISTMKNKAVSLVKNLYSNIKSTFNSVRSTATSVFNGVKNAIEKPINAAKNTVQRATNAIKGFFSGLRGKLDIKINKISTPTFKVRNWSWNPKDWLKAWPYVDVEWGAYGGILDRATMIGAGEAGKEMLLPLEGKYFRPVAQMIAEQMEGLGIAGGGAGGARVEIPVVVNGREIARAIVPNLDKEIERQRVIRRRGL